MGVSVSMRSIQRAVCERYHVARDELLGGYRDRRIARPRQVAFWLARHLTGRSYPEIGMLFGGRCHTTVLHGIRNISALTRRDPDLRDDVWMLYRDLIEAHA